MFDQCLYFNTTALARVLEREWTRAFKPFGLTPAQAFMLRAVLLQPGMLQSQLAKELVIQRPTATRVLDGLQNLGLVERRPTSNDGRGRVQPGGRRHQQHAYHARLIFFYLTSCIPN